MKKIFIAVFVLSIVFIPALTFAHIGDAEGNVSASEFSEVQDEMIKMMNGERLTSEEAQSVYSFMDDHHAGFFPAMMGYGMGYGSSMMGGGYFLYWLVLLVTLIWLFVGLLLAVFFIKKLK